MSQIKNAQIRYRVIDRCLTNPFSPFPSKEDLRQACEDALFGSTGGNDICDSTIEKDMYTMRMEFDAPIKYSKRDRGYYYEDEDYSIDKIPLSQNDVDAIRFATNTLMQFRDVGIFKQFGYAIDKIFDRVHISNNPLDESVENFVQFETVENVGGSHLLPDLLNAIQGKNISTFNYTSFVNGRTKVRKVLPLLLKEYRNRWYLISFDLGKEKVITYALDRMGELEVSDEIYTDKVEFRAERYFKYSIGITANDSRPEVVQIKVDKIGSKYLESQPLHGTQKLIKEGKKRNTYELEVIISEELKRTILSYGSQMEVISPQSLKDELHDIVLEMNEIYG